MKSRIKLTGVCIIALLAGTISLNAQKNVQLVEQWTASEGLKTPESVFYDARHDLFYVSNINGKPTEKDNNGFIAKVGINGEVMKAKWVKGMHAPKGMYLDGHLLYVTDIDRLVIIDTRKEMISKIIDVEGAKFLNDITISPAGDIYITDSENKAIYMYNEGTIEKWLDLSDYNFPNGLRFYNGKVVVGVAGSILAIEPNTQKIHTIASNTGSIDGIARDAQGNYIISDWSGVISYIMPESGKKELLNVKGEEINTADFEYIQEKNMIYVPTFFDNKVVAYELKY
ncbi:MAG: hypothetical protein GVY19_02810 [Bacteroidetes bacterium]|jgi:sugar lactone lactonase YvrE|nr:hypothetical protein [Bacteroidota bacterium]